MFFKVKMLRYQPKPPLCILFIKDVTIFRQAGWFVWIKLNLNYSPV